MKAPELFQALEKGKILPLYYFYGPEKGLMEEALARLKEKILPPASRDFNFQALDAGSDSPDAILTSLQVFPILSPRRLVVVRQADFIAARSASYFMEYLLDPNPSTCVLFIGEKADLRTKFFQALEKGGAAVAFYAPAERDLVRWLHSQAEKMGYSLSSGAVSALMDRVGLQWAELKTELQKLTLRGEKKKEITEEEVLALTGDTRMESPFQLPVAVGHLDLREMLRLLHKNLQSGESPVFLLSLIVRHLRLIRRAQDLSRQGCSRKEIEGRLRIPPYRGGDFWKQVEKISVPALQKIWPLTLETDQQLKSSRSDKGLLLEKYLWELYRTGASCSIRGIPGPGND